MQVYVELALLENFCMDFTLMYCAKISVKNPATYKRIAVSAVLGACFAVVFPLFKTGAVLSVILKIVSGLILCLVGGKFKNFKAYLKFTGAFALFCAVLGGALIGIFSLTGLEYSGGTGFIISSVPIGIPMFCALLLIIGARKLAKRLQKSHKDTVTCKIFLGGQVAEVKGFFDSGNKVYKSGAPVCIIPDETAKKFSDGNCINDEVKIHTVVGSKTIKIFTADKVEIDFGEKVKVFDKVKLGISPQPILQAVLHPDLLED